MTCIQKPKFFWLLLTLLKSSLFWMCFTNTYLSKIWLALKNAYSCHNHEAWTYVTNGPWKKWHLCTWGHALFFNVLPPSDHYLTHNTSCHLDLLYMYSFRVCQSLRLLCRKCWKSWFTHSCQNFGPQSLHLVKPRG